MSRALSPLRSAIVAGLALVLLAASTAGARMRTASPPPQARLRTLGDSVPVVDVSTPTVLAVYALPPDAVLEVKEDVASLLDDFMYYWADTRPRLDSLGVRWREQAVGWRDRRVVVRLDGREWPIALDGDSAEGAVGYVLARPGRRPRLLSGLLMDEELADSARAEFGPRPAH